MQSATGTSDAEQQAQPKNAVPETQPDSLPGAQGGIHYGMAHAETVKRLQARRAARAKKEAQGEQATTKQTAAKRDTAKTATANTAKTATANTAKTATANTAKTATANKAKPATANTATANKAKPATAKKATAETAPAMARKQTAAREEPVKTARTATEAKPGKAAAKKGLLGRALGTVAKSAALGTAAKSALGTAAKSALGTVTRSALGTVTRGSKGLARAAALAKQVRGGKQAKATAKPEKSSAAGKKR
jgi:hypothetical protein